jgi:hypothetical protein
MIMLIFKKRYQDQHLMLDNKDLKSSQAFYRSFSTARPWPFEPLESSNFENLL